MFFKEISHSQGLNDFIQFIKLEFSEFLLSGMVVAANLQLSCDYVSNLYVFMILAIEHKG